MMPTEEQEVRWRLKFLNQQLTVTNGLLQMLVWKAYSVETRLNEDVYARIIESAMVSADKMVRLVRDSNDHL